MSELNLPDPKEVAEAYYKPMSDFLENSIKELRGLRVSVEKLRASQATPSSDKPPTSMNDLKEGEILVELVSGKVIRVSSDEYSFPGDVNVVAVKCTVGDTWKMATLYARRVPMLTSYYKQVGTLNVFAGDAAEPAKDEPHCHFCGAYYDNNLQSWRFKNLPYTAMQPPTRSKPEPTKALFMRKDLIWFEATPSQDVDAYVDTLRIPAGITEGVYNRIAPGVYVEDGFEKIRNNPQFEQSDTDMIMKIVRTTLDEKGRKGTFYGKAILDFSSEECRDILYYTLSQDFNYFRTASSL